MFNNLSKKNLSLKYSKSSKLELLFNICRDRKDDIAHEILAKEEENKIDKIKLNYHGSCRSSYVKQCTITTTSMPNNANVMDEIETDDIFTRSKSSVPDFKWKKNCFICSEICSEKPKHESRYTWSKFYSLIGKK